MIIDARVRKELTTFTRDQRVGNITAWEQIKVVTFNLTDGRKIECPSKGLNPQTFSLIISGNIVGSVLFFNYNAAPGLFDDFSYELVNAEHIVSINFNNYTNV